MTLCTWFDTDFDDEVPPAPPCREKAVTWACTNINHPGPRGLTLPNACAEHGCRCEHKTLKTLQETPTQPSLTFPTPRGAQRDTAAVRRFWERRYGIDSLPQGPYELLVQAIDNLVDGVRQETLDSIGELPLCADCATHLRRLDADRT